MNKYDTLFQSTEPNSYVQWIRKNSTLSEKEAIDLFLVVDKYSNMFKVDKKLVLSVIKEESSFNQYAISPVGAMGYMQVMIRPHIDKFIQIRNGDGDPNPFNLDTNIYLGIRILKDCLSRFDSKASALKCYNGSVGMNTNYDTKVLSTFKGL